MTADRRPGLRIFIRLVIGLALVASLAYFVDFHDVITRIRQVPPWVFVISWLAWIGTAVSHVLRWRVALRSLDIRIGFARLLRLVVSGYFFNLFFPSAIGGDVYRIYGTREDASGVLKSTGVIAVERYCGFLGTFVLAIPALLVTDFGSRHPALAATVVVMFVAFVATFLIAADSRVSSFCQRLVNSMGWAEFGTMIERLSRALREFVARPGRLVAMVFYSVLMKVSIAVQIWVLAKGLDIRLDLGELMVFLPLYNLACTLPISISGLGTREVTLAAFFTEMGLSAEQATTLALLGLAWIFVSSLAAGLVFFVPGGRRTESPPS